MNPLGVNLSFAVKRWPEPEAWAAIVRNDLRLDLVQFTFDLLDPWWPEAATRPIAKRIREAVAAEGLILHSAFLGLAAYTYNGLLHPEPEIRSAATTWYERAIDVAALMGASAVGGPLGGMSVRDAANPTTASKRLDELVQTVLGLAEYASERGLSELLIEPTPLVREFPWTVEQALGLHRDLREAAVPIRFVVDLGHALYRPLYGADAGLEPWLGLGPALGMVHLQQTDGLGDSHWGFDRHGIVDLSAVRHLLRDARLDVPCLLEVFYPFELDDDSVLSQMTESVRIWNKAWADDGTP